MAHKNVFSSLFLILIFTAFATPVYSSDLILKDAPTQVCFSPAGGCTAQIIDAIGKAKSEILVQAYSFTSAPIAKALD
jgi:phosphatidylserine/phosphatidylglycerophosphate/cardiolipin synthase-like enzyme